MERGRVEMSGSGIGVILVEGPRDQGFVFGPALRAVGVRRPNGAQRGVVFIRCLMRRGKAQPHQAPIGMELTLPGRGFDVFKSQLLVERSCYQGEERVQGQDRFLTSIEQNRTANDDSWG